MKKTKTSDFVDAQQMHKDNPETFDAPSPEELNNLKIDDIVKICYGNKERFWVKIIEITGDDIKGEVDNDLIFVKLKYKDIVSFDKKNIYSIY